VTVVNAIAAVNANATAQKPSPPRPSRIADVSFVILISGSSIRPQSIAFNAKAG
jgi:hypothetical protein